MLDSADAITRDGPAEPHQVMLVRKGRAACSIVLAQPRQLQGRQIDNGLNGFLWIERKPNSHLTLGIRRLSDSQNGDLVRSLKTE
jgi:hypothetical protein